jgi:uncharacterized protein (DUF1697 family)
MIRCVALLRGINVGGKNIIKMEDLNDAFQKMGFENVKTLIQSGNVIFDSSSGNSAVLEKKIVKILSNRFNYNAVLMLRTIYEIENIIKLNPFRKTTPSPKTKFYVVFLSGEPIIKPRLPLINEKEKLELFLIKGKDAFLTSKEVKNGRYGFPNNFIEKELKVAATSRNWNTVCKLLSYK